MSHLAVETQLSGTCGWCGSSPGTKNALTPSAGLEHRAGDRRRERRDDVRVVLAGNGDAFCSAWTWVVAMARRSTPADRTSSGSSTRRAGSGGSSSRCGSRPTSRSATVGISRAAVETGLLGDGRRHPDRCRPPRLHPGYLRAGASPDGGLTWSLPTLVGHEHCASCSSPASWTPTRPSAAASSRRSSPPTNSMDGSWSSAKPSPPKRRSPMRAVPGAGAPLITDIGARPTRSCALSPGSRQRGQAGGRAGDHREAQAGIPAGVDVTDRITQQRAAVDDFLDLLPNGEETHGWGGHPTGTDPWCSAKSGLALTISAACGDAPAGSRLSLRPFSDPMHGGQEIVFSGEVVKAGRVQPSPRHRRSTPNRSSR